MAKAQGSFNKNEKEKKKEKKRQEKAQRREEKKANPKNTDFDSMIAYVDEYGNFSSTPPDPTKKKKIDAESIEIGVPKRAHEEEPAGRSGTVTFFNTSKGFGFIKDARTQESIFTHIKGHLDPIKENDKVTYEVENGPKGPAAVNVKLLK